jgi:hypothetical protein
MKTYLLLLFIACQSVVAFGQSDSDKTPYLTKSLAGADIKAVFANTSGGSISVSGATGEAPRVDVFIRGNNGRELSKEEIQKRLTEDYELTVNVNNHEVHATAKTRHNFNDWNNKGLSIAFRVYVPKQVATNLSTSGGSIHLDNLEGEQNFSTSGGSLHVDALIGHIKGRTSGGSIHVSNSKQDIDLVTSGGSVTASNCEGNIKLQTSGGSLHLDHLKGNIDASTSGGSIQGSDIEGEFITGTSGGSVNLTNLSCSLNASTSAGSIHVQMKQVGKYVKIDVSGGHVDLQLPSKQGLDLDVRGNKVTASLDNFTGSKDDDRIEGKVNGGGAPVHVNGGRVSVSMN